MERCQYTYKTCPHPRSKKKNGQLHSFCEFHRTKANAIQKVYAARKRLRDATELRPIQHAPPAPTFDLDDLEFLREWLDDHDNDDTRGTCNELSWDDVASMLDNI
ncbi:hypothetical protein SPRG_13598 [Saprolegnia parasitica CBS 223.65]|uniref:Uncharacterized protein n=1 Tax=Saprolegnia parasitica (strain CBS 223.65) TaxID=695850 RepID=A0A067BS28_SAPPC|nr:hypothetical protein SPRG_13598 [Saprolegnia parasitica CBS 223.65]KDO21299.1 hypothetical protein SPRG_13598 [Saprolegnia parasitica CBS 223.65]|eukprot:XP_012208041.1 hypothetical protein SPRG_13598 [Saprolegnia parasitica CBS 223.65]